MEELIFHDYDERYKHMKAILILTIAAMLVLTGCTNTKQAKIDTPFIGGTEGVKMNFITGAPPDQIFDGGKGEFGVFVELENVGEADVPAGAGYIEILGINPNDFGKQSQADLLEGINRLLQRSRKNFEGTIIRGDKTVVEFPRLKYTRDIHGNIPVKIRAELCYDYKTETSASICVKRNALTTGLDTKKICEISGDKTAYNSGGPVQITSLKQSPIGDDKIQIIFEIDHMGDKVNNQIYEKGSVCDDQITNNKRNRVFIRVNSRVNGRMPECSSLDERVDSASGFITLYDSQKRAITCTLDLAGVNSVYEDLFTLDLQYRYSQFIEKEITIRDVSTG